MPDIGVRLVMKTACAAAVVLALVGCTPKKTEQTGSRTTLADSIVRLSIEAHGGQEAWQNLQAISFSKTTTLFDSLGEEESTITQAHQINLKPDLHGHINWIAGEDSIQVVYTETGATRYVNGAPEVHSEIAAANTFIASVFVLFQPFKLTDPGTQLEYVGTDTLAGVAVDVVRPVYQGSDESSDQWLFYFDNETHELICNRVDHNGRISLIQNMSFDTTTPLRLHGHRKSYFVDSLNEIRYLRAEYYYTDYKGEFAPN